MLEPSLGAAGGDSPWRRLLPPGRPALPLARLRPKSLAHWISAIALVAGFVAWLGLWAWGHRGMLADPMLQTDDARTALYVFHQYDQEGAFSGDPVAHEMMGFTPPAIRLLYRAFMSAGSLFVAIKLTQALCLLIVFAAALYLVRRRRVGLAGGLLLVFLVLHSRAVMAGLAGGMTRGFVVPVFAVWVAGILANSVRLRYVAALFGALTHPSAMALILGSEGILALAGDRASSALRTTGTNLARYGILVGLCLAISVPYAMDQRKRVGPTFDLEQAEAAGVLGPGGRAAHLPFRDPTPKAADRLIGVLSYEEESAQYVPALADVWRDLENTGALVVLALILTLFAARIAPAPRGIIALIAASCILYAVARVFAFRFYAPLRYFQYGMPFATILMLVGGLGQLAPKLKSRATWRNWICLGFMAFLFAFTGAGIFPRHGANINGRGDAPLNDFVKTLPVSSRIGTHPMDGNDIPLWAARPTVCGFETLQPWWVGHWERGKARAEDTLRAFYTRDRQVVLDYCSRYGVTHLLVRRDRYLDPEKLLRKAEVFEPLDTFIRRFLAEEKIRKPEDCALSEPPDAAVVFRHRSFRLVDVALLREAWTTEDARR